MQLYRRKLNDAGQTAAPGANDEELNKHTSSLPQLMQAAAAAARRKKLGVLLRNELG